MALVLGLLAEAVAEGCAVMLVVKLSTECLSDGCLMTAGGGGSDLVADLDCRV